MSPLWISLSFLGAQNKRKRQTSRRTPSPGSTSGNPPSTARKVLANHRPPRLDFLANTVNSPNRYNRYIRRYPQKGTLGQARLPGRIASLRCLDATTFAAAFSPDAGIFDFVEAPTPLRNGLGTDCCWEGPRVSHQFGCIRSTAWAWLVIAGEAWGPADARSEPQDRRRPRSRCPNRR